MNYWKDPVSASSNTYRELLAGTYDLSPLVEIVRRNPDESSFLALMLLYQKTWLDYRRISERTKAAVLVTALRRDPWELGYLSVDESKTPMQLTMDLKLAGSALLELDPDASLPLLRDALLWEDRDTLLHGDGAYGFDAQRHLLRFGDHAYWYVRSMLGDTAELPTLDMRLALFDELAEREYRERPRIPVDLETVEALLWESYEGKGLRESSVLWRFYDKDYDVSKLVDLIGQLQNCMAYHMLLAVRRTDPQAYLAIDPVVRTRVLGRAYANVNYLDDWGNGPNVTGNSGVEASWWWIPDDSLSLTGRLGIGEALVPTLELGVDAAPVLRSIVVSDKPAVHSRRLDIWRSEGFMVPPLYKSSRSRHLQKYAELLEMGRRISVSDRSMQSEPRDPTEDLPRRDEWPDGIQE
jgi:hypothetical protein